MHSELATSKEILQSACPCISQFCDVCDPTRPDRHHPAEYAIDGSERWWQSPPLSRGMKYNEVNLTIDLGQVSIWGSRFRLRFGRHSECDQFIWGEMDVG